MKNEWSGRSVLVLGLGDTGLSCVRWLARRGARVRAADTRAAPPALRAVRDEHPEVAVALGAFDAALLEGVDAVVASPGVALREPVLRAALALGAALGMVALVVRQEIVLLIMGGVFVVETLSVIIQVASFKLTGKRVFRMAPLHHHYELKGWKENQVVVRFWIITMMLVLFGLSTLKLR